MTRPMLLWLFCCLKCHALFMAPGACPHCHYAQADKVELDDAYLAD